MLKLPVKSLLIPCLIFLCLALPKINQGDFRRDTVRYAAIGKFMWERGELSKPLIAPDKAYFNKPPLVLWIHGLFLHAFTGHTFAGKSTPIWLARLPSVLAGLLTIVAVILLVRKFIPSSAAKYADSIAVISGISLALNYEFTRRTREISLDMWQLFFIVMALNFVVLAFTGRQSSLVRKLFFGFLFGSAVALALLCKPFVGLSAFPLALIIIFLLRKGSEQKSAWRSKNISLKKWNVIGFIAFFLFAIIGVILLALPWHLQMIETYGDEFLNTYLGKQVVERARGNLATHSPALYAEMLLVSCQPWTLLAVLALVFTFLKKFRTKIPAEQLTASKPLLKYCFWHTSLFLLFLCLFPDRKVNYLLPVYPPVAILAAFALYHLNASILPKRFFPWGRIKLNRRTRSLLCVILIVLCAIVSALPFRAHKGAEADWANLFEFLETKHSAEREFVLVDFPDNDACYFYLKRGVWHCQLDAKNDELIYADFCQNLNDHEYYLIFYKNKKARKRVAYNVFIEESETTDKVFENKLFVIFKGK